MKTWVIAAACSVAGCAARQPVAMNQSPTIEKGWYRVWVRSATIAPRRPDGSPWHLSQADGTALVVGAAAGLLAGNQELGAAITGALGDKGGDPEAPLPYVAVKIAGHTDVITPIGRSYSPTWDQPIVVDTLYTPLTENVVIQVFDAIDGGLIGQTEIRVADLLSRRGWTITRLQGSLASLDIESALEPEMLDGGPD
jgi:hypothetical protein